MMKKLGIVTFALCLSVGTIGLVGCSDTATETTPAAPPAGAVNDDADVDIDADTTDTTDATTDDAAK